VYVSNSCTGHAETNIPLQSASYLSAATDDDDLSVFVQDIDARTPLRSHHRGSSLPTSPGRPLSALAGSPSAPAYLIGTGQAHDREREPLSGSREPTLTGRDFAALSGPGLVRSGSTGNQARVPSSLGPARPSRISEVTEPSSAASERPSAISESSTTSGGADAVGPMLTRPADVDARLREMNEAFVASLAGFGGGASDVQPAARRNGSGSRSGSRGAGRESPVPPSTFRREGSLPPRGLSVPRTDPSSFPRRDGSGGSDVNSRAATPGSGTDSGRFLRGGDTPGGASSTGSQEVLGRMDMSAR
jgi:autophagy-related protein 13